MIGEITVIGEMMVVGGIEREDVDLAMMVDHRCTTTSVHEGASEL